MRIDIMTLFPEMCEPFLNMSIIGRAQKNGFITVKCHQIRDFAYDKHKRVDDTPYGGGKGMVMMAQPIYDCFKSVCNECGKCADNMGRSSPDRSSESDDRRYAGISAVCDACHHVLPLHYYDVYHDTKSVRIRAENRGGAG